MDIWTQLITQFYMLPTWIKLPSHIARQVTERPSCCVGRDCLFSLLASWRPSNIQSVSQRWISWDGYSTRCHIETDVTDQIRSITQSQCTDTRQTSPTADPKLHESWKVATRLPVLKSLVWHRRDFTLCLLQHKWTSNPQRHCGGVCMKNKQEKARGARQGVWEGNDHVVLTKDGETSVSALAA